jgi:ABC-type hemin transport system ATPase subunit
MDRHRLIVDSAVVRFGDKTVLSGGYITSETGMVTGLLGRNGAGIGMKSTRTRNFEAGILTDEPALVEAAINQFDSVWAGFKCKDCARKKYCGDPILK